MLAWYLTIQQIFFLSKFVARSQTRRECIGQSVRESVNQWLPNNVPTPSCAKITTIVSEIEWSGIEADFNIFYVLVP